MQKGGKHGKRFVPDHQTGDMENILSGQISRMQELFLEELKELYGAEKHQLQVLPLLRQAAASQKLKNVFSSHLEDTREQIARLEAIFGKMKISPAARTSEAILGITREVEIVISEMAPGTATRDAGLIVAAQKLEHFEITGYGSLAQHARTLDLDEVDQLLEVSLMEEKEQDDLLTAIAENYINDEAKRE
jgi:ferritin-like metal-binding protein YciE